MAILNYTTQIKSEKTIMEINRCLVSHGASKIITDYDGITPIALTICLNMNDQVIVFSLPANYRGVLKAMKKDDKVPNRDTLHFEGV